MVIVTRSVLLRFLRRHGKFIVQLLGANKNVYTSWSNSTRWSSLELLSKEMVLITLGIDVRFL